MGVSSRRPKILKIVFSTLNFVSSGILLGLISFILYILSIEISNSYNALNLGFISIIGMFFSMLLLDRSKRFTHIFQKKKFNYRWIFISLISLILWIIGAIVYISMSDISNLDDFDIEAPNNMNLIVYGVSSLVGMIIGDLIYFGIKNLNPKAQIHKIKFSFFASLSLIFIILTSSGTIFLFTKVLAFPSPSILAGTGYNDGPWLTWQSDPTTTMTISWLTAEQNKTVVYYGEDEGDLDQVFAREESVYMHHAELTGLIPNTQYFYKVPEAFIEDHVSDTFNFTTAPIESSPRSFKFAVFGDVQPSNAEYVLQNKKVADGLINGSFDFILNTGDLATDGSDLNAWHMLMENYARVGATTPIQGSIGNHDWNGGLGSSNYGELFPYPYANPDAGRFYSFDYLNAHFVMIDNMQRFTIMTPDEIQWIQQDITAARSDNPNCWVFCFFHYSIMTTASSGHNYLLQKQMVPTFDKLDVDAVFYGHDHHYEHYNYTYGVTDGGYLWNKEDTWVHNEVQYFCTGGGGADLEVDYGVLDSEGMLETRSVQWYNPALAKYENIDYQRRAWNPTNYNEHLDFTVNYTAGNEHEGKYYFHDPSIESYDDFSTKIGFDYGEQCFQFMQVEINALGDQCIISARYPNGVLISGPSGTKPQIWTFTK
jgi:hypothetical protein